MPWSPKQHRLFEAAAHDPKVAKRVGIPQRRAATMASEGIKRAMGGLALAHYAVGGAVDDRQPMQQPQQGQTQRPMELGQLEAMYGIHPYGMAGGGKPKSLIELLKMLPRRERFDALRENELRDVSKEDAMWATLNSPPSPVSFYGPFPDHKVKSGFGMLPRSRQRFMLFDGTRPDETGHATELGSISANWGNGWKPQDLIDIDLLKQHQRMGYGRETLASLLSTVKNENDRFPLYDVKRSAKKYWESLGAQMKDPSKPFRMTDKTTWDEDGFERLSHLPRNNDYYITPGDFLENVDKFAEGGMVDEIGGGDARLDPRSRAIAAVNKRIAQQETREGAMRASMDITRPLRRRDPPLTLPMLSRPGAVEYARRAPALDAPEFGRYPVPEARGYAEGGEVERSHLPEALGVAAAALRPRMVNALSRPIMRAMARPHLGVEAVSKFPLSAAESDARFNIAREAAMHPHSDRPVHRLQGAWSEGVGHPYEFNPLYVQELPRTLGKLSGDREALRYAGQMGENLEQMATPVNRFVPHLWNTPEGANAMEFSGVDRERVKSIAKRMGQGWIPSHRPGDKLFTFPLDDSWSLSKIARQIEKEYPGVKTRYGRSDAGTDRVLLAREPLGYEDATYADVGAMPRSDAYAAFEGAALRRPAGWALKGAK